MHCGILYVLKQYITTLDIHNCCFLLAAYLYWRVGIDGKPEHRVSCCVCYLFFNVPESRYLEYFLQCIDVRVWEQPERSSWLKAGVASWLGKALPLPKCLNKLPDNSILFA